MGCGFSFCKEPLKREISRNHAPNKKTILYVEDSEIYYTLMQFILQKYNNLNITLVWKKTISTAYDYIKSHKIDLLFLDRLLENEMGEDLIKIINEEQLPLDNSRIIIISTLDNPDEVKFFSDMGIKYFKKPINIELFINQINKLFDIIDD